MINKTVWEKQIRKELQEKDPTQLEIIYKLISLVLYNNSENDDQVKLYNALGLTGYIQFNKTFNGKSAKSISCSKLKDLLIFAVCFYYREIKGLTFTEIKKKIPFELDNRTSISYGIRMKSLSKEITNEMKELFRKR